uniref:Serine/threonine-protein kinase TTK/MPS1 n=1 Tax=Rhipicephalus appendiculatus TaxID=34631 RepID=A0A131Z0M7_RHIAP
MLGETPPLFRKCKEDPSLFKVRLEISDDEDESDEEKRKPDIPSMKRGSSCPKPLPSSSTPYKKYPSSSVTHKSSIHKLSPAKGPFSGMHKYKARSCIPQQLQQQYSSKRGRMPSKASHGARAQGAALSSSRPCKAASIKSDSRSDEGSGRPVKDGASGRRPCRTSHEENNGVQHSHQLEAQQVLKVSRHSKKKSLLSVLLDVKPPTEDFYIEINEKRYHMLSLIGRGGSSKVFMMFDHQKELRAVKLVNLADVPPSVMQAYMQEVAILKELRSCDRVVCLFDCELNKKDNVLALVMEKGDQDLATVLMNRKGNLGPVTIKFYWSEMLQAVKEIHDKRVVHSDLKPANFLFVAGKLKLIDFGIANKIQEDVTSVLKESPMGTLNFMSPESIKYTSQKQGKDYLKIGLKSDVWSLGCILYNLVYGKTPFQHISATAAKLLAIVDKKQPIDFPDVPDPHLMDVLTKCLQRDPEQRPSISKLLEHPYLVEEVMPLPGKQCMDPHVQSLINEIENLSPGSVKKMEEVLKAMRKDRP